MKGILRNGTFTNVPSYEDLSKTEKINMSVQSFNEMTYKERLAMANELPDIYKKLAAESERQTEQAIRINNNR